MAFLVQPEQGREESDWRGLSEGQGQVFSKRQQGQKEDKKGKEEYRQTRFKRNGKIGGFGGRNIMGRQPGGKNVYTLSMGWSNR